MWDGRDPATGDPTKKTVAKVTVEQVSPGKATLVIAPDAAWFMDPARVFPVTVDPTYVTGTRRRTSTPGCKAVSTSDQSTSNELRVGYNGSQTARSYPELRHATFAGKDILSATLSLWQTTSLSCTASAIVARSSTPATDKTRWSNKPALGASYGTVSAAKGFSSACPGGRISVPITGLAQAWSTASYPTGGMSLTAATRRTELVEEVLLHRRDRRPLHHDDLEPPAGEPPQPRPSCPRLPTRHRAVRVRCTRRI